VTPLPGTIAFPLIYNPPLLDDNTCCELFTISKRVSVEVVTCAELKVSVEIPRVTKFVEKLVRIPEFVEMFVDSAVMVLTRFGIPVAVLK
jgi:hypothetical protein